MKICSLCGEEKEDSKFYQKRSKQCKPCYNNQQMARRKERNADFFGQIRRRYGLSVLDWCKMMVDANGQCQICSEVTEDLVIDHCHNTGQVRGLLCRSCNLALGYVRDDRDILIKMVKYLGGDS